MSIKNPAEVANALANIYEESFGGKDRGRYQISRQGLRNLSGRKRLEDTIVNDIINEAYELGFVLTDMGDDFSIIEEGVMRSYRKVPDRVISKV